MFSISYFLCLMKYKNLQHHLHEIVDDSSERVNKPLLLIIGITADWIYLLLQQQYNKATALPSFLVERAAAAAVINVL